jgi:hypothetical protein
MERVSSNALAGALEERKIGNALLKRWFLISLLLATWLPILFFVWLAPPVGASGGLAGIKTVFLFLGTAHVPATIFFYTDQGFSAIRKSHPFRYIYVPLLLVVLTGLVFVFSTLTVQAFVLLIFWSWQAFHYGRQNVGIYAFASIAETGRAPQQAEKLAIEAGTILAILGTLKVLGMAVAPAYLHPSFDFLYRFGFVAFLAVAVFSIVVYARYFRETSPLKTIFFFTTVFFFLPIFLSTDNNIGFLSYAIAHGLQYIIFMTVISATATEPRPFPYKSLTVFLILLLLVGFAFWRVNDLREMEFVKGTCTYARAADFLFGAVMCDTMSHFVIDASAWRLSLEKQRSYIKKRFYFVFD